MQVQVEKQVFHGTRAHGAHGYAWRLADECGGHVYTVRTREFRLKTPGGHGTQGAVAGVAISNPRAGESLVRALVVEDASGEEKIRCFGNLICVGTQKIGTLRCVGRFVYRYEHLSDRDHSFTFGLRRVTGRVRIYKITGETKMRVGQIAQQENERCIAEVLSSEKNPMIWLVILFIADYCFKTGSGFFLKG